MISYTNTDLPKICHAKVGQHLRLPDAETGAVLPEVFMVVADPRGWRGKTLKSARPNMSHGLYDEERTLKLASLSTGVLREMPNLSSRAELIKGPPTDILVDDSTPLTPMARTSRELVVLDLGKLEVWRQDVAAGKTLMSFEQYLNHLAA